jgi:alkylhydroperoxidase/carboxymuconolactone decarboxylase family protein YurZ
MSYGKTVRDGLQVPTRELRHAIPQVYAGYRELHDAALAAGALDVRTKELIALAIAVSKEAFQELHREYAGRRAESSPAR